MLGKKHSLIKVIFVTEVKLWKDTDIIKDSCFILQPPFNHYFVVNVYEYLRVNVAWKVLSKCIDELCEINLLCTI